MAATAWTARRRTCERRHPPTPRDDGPRPAETGSQALERCVLRRTVDDHEIDTRERGRATRATAPPAAASRCRSRARRRPRRSRTRGRGAGAADRRRRRSLARLARRAACAREAIRRDDRRHAAATREHQWLIADRAPVRLRGSPPAGHCRCARSRATQADAKAARAERGGEPGVSGRLAAATDREVADDDHRHARGSAASQPAP